jgi:hypothetical protein
MAALPGSVDHVYTTAEQSRGSPANSFGTSKKPQFVLPDDADDAAHESQQLGTHATAYNDDDDDDDDDDGDGDDDDDDDDDNDDDTRAADLHAARLRLKIYERALDDATTPAERTDAVQLISAQASVIASLAPRERMGALPQGPPGATTSGSGSPFRANTFRDNSGGFFGNAPRCSIFGGTDRVKEASSKKHIGNINNDTNSGTAVDIGDWVDEDDCDLQASRNHSSFAGDRATVKTSKRMFPGQALTAPHTSPAKEDALVEAVGENHAAIVAFDVMFVVVSCVSAGAALSANSSMLTAASVPWVVAVLVATQLFVAAWGALRFVVHSRAGEWEIVDTLPGIRDLYFRTWFVFDLLHCVPFDWIFLGWATPVYFACQLRNFLRVVRVISQGSSGNPLKQRRRAFTFLSVCCCIALLLHCIAVGFMELEGVPYVEALYWTFACATSVGFGDVVPSAKVGSRIFAMFAMLLGVLIISVMTAFATSTLTTKDKRTEQADARKDMMHSMLQYYDVPWHVQRNVISMFPAVLERELERDFSRMTETMPRFVAEEIEGFARAKTLRMSVPVFAQLARRELILLSHCIEQHFFPADEYVFAAGDAADAMFFLVHGVVDVVIEAFQQATVVATLRSGAFFGEAALLESDMLRSASVWSVSVVEALSLSRVKFEEFIADNPELSLVFNDLIFDRLGDEDDDSEQYGRDCDGKQESGDNVDSADSDAVETPLNPLVQPDALEVTTSTAGERQPGSPVNKRHVLWLRATEGPDEDAPSQPPPRNALRASFFSPERHEASGFRDGQPSTEARRQSETARRESRARRESSGRRQSVRPSTTSQLVDAAARADKVRSGERRRSTVIAVDPAQRDEMQCAKSVLGGTHDVKQLMAITSSFVRRRRLTGGPSAAMHKSKVLKIKQAVALNESDRDVQLVRGANPTPPDIFV